jgi:hypothetical protein
VHGLVDANYQTLLPTVGYAVGQSVPKESFRQAIAVQVDGQTIAWRKRSVGL